VKNTFLIHVASKHIWLPIAKKTDKQTNLSIYKLNDAKERQTTIEWILQ